ncbi:MAG: DUF6155 family protein [Bacteroidales bacterium]|nr:DUF6155 family protein [Bacteroidales bacterium]
MSKQALKKHLQSLTKEQMIVTVLEMYDGIKPVKEYLEYYLNPNEKEMYEKYRRRIVDEFSLPTRKSEPKLRFSVAKKAIADFRSLKPSPELLGDLMVTLAEMACKFTYDYGDMWEQYYDSAYNNFKNALVFLEKNNLLDYFKLRCEDCVKYASPCGYGFADDISEIYYQYYK